MNSFWKLNMISALYALIIFIPVELFVNTLRIQRVMDWEITVTGVVVGITAFAFVILLSISVMYLTRKWLRGRKSSFWSIVLWIPYFALLLYIYVSVFPPIVNPSEQGGPGDGIIVLGLLFVYPFYIILLNSISAFARKNKTRHP